MSVHAFVDESRRNDTYYLAAAVVHPRDLRRLRSGLRRLLFPGQRELHFCKEKQARRKLLLSKVVELEARVDIYRADCRRGEERARQECLTRLTDDLLDVRGHRVVLDSRQERDFLDAHTITRVLDKRPGESRLVYEHCTSSDEPLLWLADIAAWCHGAGGRLGAAGGTPDRFEDQARLAVESAKRGTRPSGGEPRSLPRLNSLGCDQVSRNGHRNAASRSGDSR